MLAVNGSLEVAKELEAKTLNLDGELRGGGKVVVPGGGKLEDTGYASVGVTELVNNGSATVAAERSLDVRAGSKFANKGALTLNVGSSFTGDCGHAANATEPELPNGELASSGSITTNGKTETGSNPVSIGVNGECLTSHQTGSLNAASGELRLGGQDYNVDTGATITGGAGAVLNFQGTVSLNAAATTITAPISVTGAVVGKGNLTASSLKVAGTLDDTGVIKVGSAGTLGLEDAQLQAGELLNEGTASLTTNDYAYIGQASKFVNKGALSLAVGSTLYGGCGHEATATEPAVANGEFVSSGSITANASGGLADIGPNGYCMITHDSGSLNVASGELKLAGQTFNFDTGSTVTGGATTTLTLESTTNFNASSTTLPAPVLVTGGVGGAGNVTADKLKLDGDLDGTGTWTVPASGTLTIENGQVDGGELVNEGTATLPLNEAGYVGREAKFLNKGALNMEAGSFLYGGCGHEATATEPEVANGEFLNGGSITANGTTKTGSSPVSIGEPYNYCLITHDTGSLKAASGELKLGGQTFNFDTGSTVSGGTGEKLVLEDVVAFNAANTTLPLPVVVGGETTGAGDVAATTSLKLNGTLNGTGAWTVPSTATLTLEGGQVDGGSELVNEGMATIPANESGYVGQASKFTNKGALSMAVGSYLYGGCGREATATEPAIANGEFVSSGSIVTNGTTKTGSTPVTIGYPYNYCLVTHDSGSLNVESGELKLGGQTFNFDTGSTVTGAKTSQLVLEDVVAFNAANTTLPIPVVVSGETSWRRERRLHRLAQTQRRALRHRHDDGPERGHSHVRIRPGRRGRARERRHGDGAGERRALRGRGRETCEQGLAELRRRLRPLRRLRPRSHGHGTRDRQRRIREHGLDHDEREIRNGQHPGDDRVPLQLLPGHAGHGLAERRERGAKARRELVQRQHRRHDHRGDDVAAGLGRHGRFQRREHDAARPGRDHRHRRRLRQRRRHRLAEVRRLPRRQRHVDDREQSHDDNGKRRHRRRATRERRRDRGDAEFVALRQRGRETREQGLVHDERRLRALRRLRPRSHGDGTRDR